MSRNNLTFARKAIKLLGSVTDNLEDLLTIGYLNDTEVGLIVDAIFKTERESVTDGASIVQSQSAIDEVVETILSKMIDEVVKGESVTDGMSIAQSQSAIDEVVEEVALLAVKSAASTPTKQKNSTADWHHFSNNVKQIDNKVDAETARRVAAIRETIDPSSAKYTDIWKQTIITTDGQRIRVNGNQMIIRNAFDDDSTATGENNVAAEKAVGSSSEEVKNAVEATQTDGFMTVLERHKITFVSAQTTETESIQKKVQTEVSQATIEEDDYHIEAKKKPIMYMGQLQFHEDGVVLGSSAPPLRENIGLQMLQRQGWKTGEGLGKNGAGILTPLTATIKNTRAGLGMDLKASSCPSSAFTGPVGGWDTVSPRLSDSKNKENEISKNEVSQTEAASIIPKWDTLHKTSMVSRALQPMACNVPSKTATVTADVRVEEVKTDATPKIVAAPMTDAALKNDAIPKKDAAQKDLATSTNDVGLKTDTEAGNVSAAQVKSSNNNAVPKTNGGPKKELFTKGLNVRFHSEGPSGRKRFKFGQSTTGGKNGQVGPTNHYYGAVIETRDMRLGDNKGFFACEKGDRFEVLENRGRDFRKFLVRKVGGDERGFLNFSSVEMDPVQYAAAAGVRSPSATSITSNDVRSNSSGNSRPPMEMAQ